MITIVPASVLGDNNTPFVIEILRMSDFEVACAIAAKLFDVDTLLNFLSEQYKSKSMRWAAECLSLKARIEKLLLQVRSVVESNDSRDIYQEDIRVPFSEDMLVDFINTEEIIDEIDIENAYANDLD